MRLREAAKVIRSKNAGPTILTIDLMFDKRENYDRAIKSEALSPAAVQKLYNVEGVKVIHCPAALAIKIAMPRKIIAGSPGDGDVYGAQQHTPLLGVEI